MWPFSHVPSPYLFGQRVSAWPGVVISKPRAVLVLSLQTECCFHLARKVWFANPSWSLKSRALGRDLEGLSFKLCLPCHSHIADKICLQGVVGGVQFMQKALLASPWPLQVHQDAVHVFQPGKVCQFSERPPEAMAPMVWTSSVPWTQRDGPEHDTGPFSPYLK